MNLKQVLELLATGELSQANLGGNDVDGITSNNTRALINHINMGMTALYTRFNLKMRELYLQPVDQYTNYILHSRYALSVDNDLPKWIIDSEFDKFTDDILKIEAVYLENGCKVPLNNKADCTSVFTPAFNEIQIPCPDGDTAYSILYRAAPTLLVTNKVCGLEQEVEVPITHIPALLAYVAHRFHASRTHANSLIESNNYLTKFNQEVETLKLTGTDIDNNTVEDRLRRLGWV